MIVYNVQYTLKWKTIISTSLLQLFISWYNTSIHSGEGSTSQPVTAALLLVDSCSPWMGISEFSVLLAFPTLIIRGYILL